MNLIPIIIVILSLLGAGRGMTAPTFSVTLSQDGNRITLRYPSDVGEWRQVCVHSYSETFEATNCWTPHVAVEDFALHPKTATVESHLTTARDGVLQHWFTRPIHRAQIQGD